MHFALRRAAATGREIEVFTTRADTLFGVYSSRSPRIIRWPSRCREGSGARRLRDECGAATSAEAIETRRKMGYDTGLRLVTLRSAMDEARSMSPTLF